MLENLKGKQFEYKKLSEDEQKSRGILGRLIGPCADFINPTRNGRAYSEQLWENVFENPIMKEKIATRCAFGELGHPENRAYVDIEKVALCLAEQPKKGPDGKLYGVFDILNTPNGKILKALCDYGCKIGISSRGQGDVDEMDNSVDPNTYDCEGFDAVLVPGVEAARLKYVTEDYKSVKKSNLKTVLAESLNTATESEKKVMMETIKTLDLNEALVKEIKLSDCTKLESADQAAEINQKVKAKWCFGMQNSLGINAGEKCFEMFTKSMDLFVHENGKDSVCFGVKRDGSIYGPYDINNNPVVVNILATLNDETTLPPVEEVSEPIETDETKEVKESLIEKTEKSTDEMQLEPISDEIVIDEPIIEEPEVNPDAEEASVIADEETKDEQPEIDKEEVFMDFLANNFDEDKVRKVCKLLDIEIEGDEQPEEGEEQSSDAEAKAPVEDKDGEEEADKIEEPVQEAIDDGAKTLVNSLKEALKGKSDLENTVKSLQEKLAVSDAKVNEINEECNKFKESVVRLSLLAKSLKDLKEKNSELEESLKQKTAVVLTQKERIARLAESSKVITEKTKLNEDLNEKLTEIKQLNEAFEVKTAEYEKTITTLNNQKNQTDSQVKALTENVTKVTNLKESYRKLANKAVNKYIEVKSEMLGLTPADIKRKLGVAYTMEDVDQVCEDLKQYQLNVSRLPFSVDRKVGVRVNESKTSTALNVQNPKMETDDEVDDTLIKLANFTR